MATKAKKTFVRPDYIVAVQDVKTEEVRVPEWDSGNVEAWVLVRGMTGNERDDWEASMAPDPAIAQNWKRMTAKQRQSFVRQRMVGARARLVARCCVDEEGERLFSDGDIEMLGSKSASAIERIYKVAASLSGVRDEDVAEIAETIESDPTSDSNSDSA